MELLLHVGMRKTASTYIQTLCYHNQSLLETNNIYFPVPDYVESKLKQGKLNPGNAETLYENLRKKEDSNFLHNLKNYVDEAKEKGLSKLLLSNEKLFIPLSEVKVSDFINKIKSTGIDSLRIILIVRNPINHALSLYKHQNMTGRFESFTEWFQKKYNSFKYVEKLAEVFGSNILSIKKMETQPIEITLFKDWLGVSGFTRNIQTANVSLTISEIHTLQNLRKNGLEILAGFTYQDLLDLDSKDKFDDRQLEFNYKSYLYHKLKSEINLKLLKEYFTKDENFNKVNNLFIDEKKVMLSQSQLKVIFNSFKFYNSPKGQLKKTFRKNVKYIPKILIPRKK